MKRLQRARQRVRATFRRMPSEAILDRGSGQDKQKAAAEGGRVWDEMGIDLESRLRAVVPMRWSELRAIELALEEASEEFGGEDVLRPEIRQVLDDTKCKIQEARDAMQSFGEPLELSEPDEDRLSHARELLRRAVENH